MHISKNIKTIAVMNLGQKVGYTNCGFISELHCIGKKSTTSVVAKLW